MKYLVMIADVVGSRQLDHREDAQRRLEAVLEELNEDGNQLLSPYTITLGDEFQALFSAADRVFPDLLAVMRALHPVGLRFALAIGALSTPVNPVQAIGMDGQAFYRARDLLERMKKQDLTIAVAGLPGDDQLLDGALSLLNHHIRKWHPNRLDILQLLLQGFAVSAIAQRLDISEQGVYKNIRDGALEPTIQLIRALTANMNSALMDAN